MILWIMNHGWIILGVNLRASHFRNRKPFAKHIVLKYGSIPTNARRMRTMMILLLLSNLSRKEKLRRRRARGKADGKSEKKGKKKKPKKSKSAASTEDNSTKSSSAKNRPKLSSPAPLLLDTSVGRPPSTTMDIGGLDEFDMDNLDIVNFDVDLEGFGDIDLEELEL